MSIYPQKTGDLFILTKEILNKNLHFCAVIRKILSHQIIAKIKPLFVLPSFVTTKSCTDIFLTFL